MRSWPMLILRGETWYFRRTVPAALRPLYGKREVWKSLGTSDKAKAKLLSLREAEKIEREFQALRRNADALRTDPEALARLYESRTLGDDLTQRTTMTPVERLGLPEGPEGEEWDGEYLSVEQELLARAIEEHAAAIRRGDTRLVTELLDELVKEQKLPVPTHRRQDFALALLKAHTRTLEMAFKRSKDGPRVKNFAASLRDSVSLPSRR